MNEELVPYSFQDCILFCSKSKYGACYLTCNKTIIIEQGSSLKKFAIPVFASEAYLLTANKLLLVIDLSRHDLSDEHFTFKILVFDISTGATLQVKDFKECDLRGLKINHEENEIRLAINTYDFETHIIVDPDELYCYPPLPTLARSSEVLHLDFSLNTKREYSFEENLPDDLILRVGSLDDQEEVIDFNSSIRLCPSAGDLSSAYEQLRKMLGYEFYVNIKMTFILKEMVVFMFSDPARA